MSTLLIYYSYSGNVKKLAEETAQKEGADLYEVLDEKRPGMLKALLVGCPKAMNFKASPARPITADYSAYDKILVMAPIWAGHPAPVINNVFDALPAGKDVALRLMSGGGTSNKERILAHLEGKGLHVVEYTDLTGAPAPET